MILNDTDILGLTKSNLLEPFSVSQLSGATYDVTLDDVIHEISATSDIVNLNDQSFIDDLYVERDISEGYLIKPNQFILGTLKEKVTLPDDVVACILPRTRFTRLGLIVSGQYCNPSYSGRLQIGILNASPNNISIVKGLSIAQLIFARLESAPSSERLYKNQRTSAYQDEDEFIGAKFDNELSPESRRIYDRMVAELLG